LKQFRAVVASSLGRGPATVPTMVPSSLPSSLVSSVASSFPPSLPPPSPAARPEPAANQAAAVAAVVNAARANKIAPPAAVAIPESAALRRMAGDSPGMQQVRELIEKVARSMAPVLVSGESGTGKELVARAIHEVSPRHAQPFIAVNCSAIPEQLLEAEFFGYRKGAFTGAMEDREGFFQAANGGTLFLDEIGELPLSMQSKLLRAIQERSVRPVGAMNELAVNVRLLSATHKDLGAEVQAGQFRQDLYYRLNVIQICVPPLRERTADLRLISERVLERIARDANVLPAPILTRDALVHLARYPFPGNVRELENLLHRAVALTGGESIDVFDLGLPESVFTDTAAQELDLITSNTRFDVASLDSLDSVSVAAQAPASFAASEPTLPDDLARYLDDVERDILVRSLERYRYNRTAAGASLGLSLRQMRYRMARLNVTVGGDAFDA
jgi:two-component system, NtrC family, response regulator PilR